MFAVGVLAGLIFAICVLVGFHLGPEDLQSVTMSYADLAAIMLGAVSVIVTVLGVGIAVLALWGYAQFKQSAAKAAHDHVDDELKAGVLRDQISHLIVAEVTKQMDDGKLRKIMEERVDRQRMLGASQRAAEQASDLIGDEEKEYGE
ncbi:hypothetical protein [Shinella zoogloeoides]|uniref:hypothetical protein n=1 Tax=Shinella zoogloeoides TaxID=352475 RepID=UPI000E655D1A|nr:hypothetical protein [Shinella zoogloeoides]